MRLFTFGREEADDILMIGKAVRSLGRQCSAGQTSDAGVPLTEGLENSQRDPRGLAA